MRYFILIFVAMLSLNAKEGATEDNLKDFNFISVGISPILPAYRVTQNPSWIFIPEVAVGQRHFISKRNAVDYGVALRLNFNIQMAHVHADYLFFPMPKYGFYAGAGISMNECFYFCCQKDKFHYWPAHHALVGLQFKLNDGMPAFVRVRYSQDGILSLLYGFSF